MFKDALSICVKVGLLGTVRAKEDRLANECLLWSAMTVLHVFVGEPWSSRPRESWRWSIVEASRGAGTAILCCNWHFTYTLRSHVSVQDKRRASVTTEVHRLQPQDYA